MEPPCRPCSRNGFWKRAGNRIGGISSRNAVNLDLENRIDLAQKLCMVAPDDEVQFTSKTSRRSRVNPARLASPATGLHFPVAGLLLSCGFGYPPVPSRHRPTARAKDSQGLKGRGSKNKPSLGHPFAFRFAGGKGGIEKDSV